MLSIDIHDEKKKHFVCVNRNEEVAVDVLCQRTSAPMVSSCKMSVPPCEDIVSINKEKEKMEEENIGEEPERMEEEEVLLVSKTEEGVRKFENGNSRREPMVSGSVNLQECPLNHQNASLVVDSLIDLMILASQGCKMARESDSIVAINNAKTSTCAEQCIDADDDDGRKYDSKLRNLKPSKTGSFLRASVPPFPASSNSEFPMSSPLFHSKNGRSSSLGSELVYSEEPTYSEMIIEAIRKLGGQATAVQITSFIHQHFPGIVSTKTKTWRNSVMGCLSSNRRNLFVKEPVKENAKRYYWKLSEEECENYCKRKRALEDD